ncbi:unnamed protein product, partial [Iphiclides podalirius]
MMCIVKLCEFVKFITLLGFIININAFRVFDYNGVETILALENEFVPIRCKTDLPMSYCGFLHPSGKRYSITGLALNNGNCVVEINATKADVGEWKCHIGMKSKRVEVMQEIDLRVVEHVAAIRANLTAIHGKAVTLECVTTKGLVPLSYCRFEPPNGSPFSIDSTVNASNPILNKYYFPPNRSLDRGDCAVTIRKVKYEDVGIWTCGAALDGQEYTDFITVEVEGLYAMSTASVAGLTLGGILIAGILGLLGYVAWQRRWFLGIRRHQEGDVIEIQEMGQRPIPQSTPQGSPQRRRLVPTVVVQSPSEPSESVSST